MAVKIFMNSKKIRIILISVAVAIFVFLFIQDYQPDGVLEVSSNFSEPTSYFSNYSPRETLGPKEIADGQLARRVNGRTIGFDLRLPRWFKTADVRIVWKPADGAYSEKIESVSLSLSQMSFDFPSNAALPIHVASIKVVARR